METCLLLNAGFEPLRVVDWRRAFCLVFQDKVEILEEHTTVVRSVSSQFRLPAVIRLRRWVNLKRRPPIIRFSRSNIYLRDEYTCQYCAKKFTERQLTLDHVLPVVRGGRKNWENIVTACMPCNQRKGDRTPEEMGHKLLRTPQAPRWLPGKLGLARQRGMPKVWERYLANLTFELA